MSKLRRKFLSLVRLAKLCSMHSNIDWVNGMYLYCRCSSDVRPYLISAAHTADIVSKYISYDTSVFYFLWDKKKLSIICVRRK